MALSIHPGEILLEEYLNPLNVSQNALARALAITPKTISEIVLGKRGVSAEMSIQLGKFFGQSPRFNLSKRVRFSPRSASPAKPDDESRLAQRLARSVIASGDHGLLVTG